MKKITQREIDIVKGELSAKRKEFDQLKICSLEKRLKWIRNFFNSYIPELEKRYMDKKDFKKFKFLPDEIRIQFYLYFPEHGLNMAHYSEKLAQKLLCEHDIKRAISPENIEELEDRIFLRHQD